MKKHRVTLIGMLATMLWAGAVSAAPVTVPAKGGLPACQSSLDQCNANLLACENNVSALPEGFPATGQTISYVAGDDGAIKAGAPLSYTDNGDTITDNNTKLMWEKKDQSGGLHDVRNTYPWAGLCSSSGAICGTSVDCTSGETCLPAGGATYTIFQWLAQLNAGKFAGYSDWRIPNVKELQSIVDYGKLNPAVDTVFNTTQAAFYWSATTAMRSATWAWLVGFEFGEVNFDNKGGYYYVRAVRSGP